jgi:hypothetical protein
VFDAPKGFVLPANLAASVTMSQSACGLIVNAYNVFGIMTGDLGYGWLMGVRNGSLVSDMNQTLVGVYSDIPFVHPARDASNVAVNYTVRYRQTS